MKYKPMVKVLVAAALLSVSSWTSAARGIESRPVTFAPAASIATIKGTIKGDQTIDYKLRARAGQAMTVALTTSNPGNYFNVLPPGSSGEALFVGSTSGNAWTGTLPADGEYAIRVYLMRSAARRHETARYTLSVGVPGGAAADAGMGSARPGDAKVKGTPYHATGQVPCSMASAAPGSAQCAFGVIRGKAGQAEVRLTTAGGGERVLRFDGGKVSGDAGAKVKASLDGDLWSIDVDAREFYRIPAAVVSGG